MAFEKWKNPDTDRLVDVLSKLNNKDDIYAFLDDICTIKEVLDISQRLSVATMLDKKESYTEIASKTGAGTATISRVNKCYEYGSGGYGIALEILSENNKNN